jgi:vacuolar iron transporter family protein
MRDPMTLKRQNQQGPRSALRNATFVGDDNARRRYLPDQVCGSREIARLSACTDLVSLTVSEAAVFAQVKCYSMSRLADYHTRRAIMTRLKLHEERHLVERIGWLRAAVLGANDGIVSTASLIVGVAAAAGGKNEVLVAGLAGLVAGAMSMAAGEYVSVSSQSDTEQADMARERGELATLPEGELQELTAIYVSRGLEPGLARQVAEAMTKKDALAAHIRDELGISHFTTAKPVQAALTSAGSFSLGAALPLAVAVVTPSGSLSLAVIAASLLFLGLLGAMGARAGGATILKPTVRVLFWGALAMAATYGIGKLFGTVVG